MSLIRLLVCGLIVFLPAGATSATTWAVSPTGGCGDSTCTPCCTIQGAVYKSVGGDTISVEPGTYPEQIDFRNMLTVGDITLEATSGPGTVFVSPASGHTLRHGGSYTNTVTIDGVDFSSAMGSSCVYIDHQGDVVLTDVTANNCGYTSFVLDNPGSVTMERCTAEYSDRTGIQIDGASSAALTDCVGNSNIDSGIRIYMPSGTVEVINPTAVGNGGKGVDIDGHSAVSVSDGRMTDNGEDGLLVSVSSTVVIEDATVERNTGDGISIVWYDSDPVDAVTLTRAVTDDNGRNGMDLRNIAGPTVITDCDAAGNEWSGIGIETEGTTTVNGAALTGNGDLGIDIDWDGVTPAGGVTLTDTYAGHNGHASGDSGVRLRNINGPVVVTNCTFNDNGSDGFSPESSVMGDLEVYGGMANGNAEDGYDLRVTGNATVIGAVANNNIDQGFKAEIPGTVFFQNCIASNNEMGSGFDLEWQDPDRIDGISVVECTAIGNGLLDGGEGISIRYVDGPVTVRESVATGNAYSGVRIRDAYGTVLIRDVTATDNLEEGIEIDIDGPATIVDNIVDGNIEAGLDIDVADLALESFTVKRNTITGNGGTGVVVWDLGGAGPYAAKCNDITGNGGGMYLDGSLTVDARWIWWGNATGPSGQGPGTGDAIFAEPGGSITFTPWLVESFTAPISGCPFFDSGFETGQLEEWDLSAP